MVRQVAGHLDVAAPAGLVATTTIYTPRAPATLGRRRQPQPSPSSPSLPLEPVAALQGPTPIAVALCWHGQRVEEAAGVCSFYIGTHHKTGPHTWGHLRLQALQAFGLQGLPAADLAQLTLHGVKGGAFVLKQPINIHDAGLDGGTVVRLSPCVSAGLQDAPSEVSEESQIVIETEAIPPQEKLRVLRWRDCIINALLLVILVGSTLSTGLIPQRYAQNALVRQSLVSESIQGRNVSAHSDKVPPLALFTLSLASSTLPCVHPARLSATHAIKQFSNWCSQTFYDIDSFGEAKTWVAGVLTMVRPRNKPSPPRSG
jgi:hypothetical protein